MRIVFLYPPLMMAWLEQLVGAICLLTAGTACQRIYNIFLEGLFCIFARLVRGLQTNSVGSITSRILLIPPATAYYIRYGPGGLSCMLIYLPRYQRISIGSRRATSCVFDYYHYH